MTPTRTPLRTTSRRRCGPNGILRLAAPAVLSLSVVAAAAGCGSTRYVVVDNQGAGAAPAAAQPAAAAAGPASAPDDAAIRDAVAVALSLDESVDFAARQEYLVDADDIEPTYLAVAELVRDFDVEVTVDEVTTTGDSGIATITIGVDGAPFAEGVPVEVVRDGGTWKVTRGGACAALAVGSPCPEP